jgi:hypothetical protein
MPEEARQQPAIWLHMMKGRVGTILLIATILMVGF